MAKDLGFLTVWCSLSEQGFCDSAHSAEYDRIRKAWVKAGKPANITEFIKGSANQLPAKVISPNPFTLGSLSEGKKFQYAVDNPTITFMKVLQPLLDKFNPVTLSDLGDNDGRYYLPWISDISWVVILESKNDCDAIVIGKITFLNNQTLVREVL